MSFLIYLIISPKKKKKIIVQRYCKNLMVYLNAYSNCCRMG